MRYYLASGVGQLLRWLRRPLILLSLVLVTGVATVGFIHQEQTVNQLTEEVAQRQQELDDARQAQQTLIAELAALNDPVHYGQYAALVARHTVMMTRPGETLLIVNWQVPGDQPTTAPRPTDWKALLRAANIPSP